MYLAPYAWLTGSGFGMLREIPERLLALGVDLVTGGNHSWDGPEMEAVPGHPRVLRPLNYSSATPRKGFAVLEQVGNPYPCPHPGHPGAAQRYSLRLRRGDDRPQRGHAGPPSPKRNPLDGQPPANQGEARVGGHVFPCDSAPLP